jgi:hypothetical protein
VIFFYIRQNDIFAIFDKVSFDVLIPSLSVKHPTEQTVKLNISSFFSEISQSCLTQTSLRCFLENISTLRKSKVTSIKQIFHLRFYIKHITTLEQIKCFSKQTNISFEINFV